jgi:hypothetical protein
MTNKYNQPIERESYTDECPQCKIPTANVEISTYADGDIEIMTHCPTCNYLDLRGYDSRGKPK